MEGTNQERKGCWILVHPPFSFATHFDFVWPAKNVPIVLVCFNMNHDCGLRTRQ